MIEYAIMDLDSCAYLGASVAIKTIYQWEKKGSDEVSPEFTKAALAKEWIEREEAFEGINPNEWTRTVRKEDLGEKTAISALDHEMKGWARTARELTGNSNIKFKGFLTSSGLKNKDIMGLPDRYQFNRYDKQGLKYEDWVPKPKPSHLQACREHLLAYYNFVKVSPKKIEADAPCILLAEKYGYNAVLMSKDKDLKQTMNTNYIDMNPKERKRELIQIDTLGVIEEKPVRFNDKELFATGFRLYCAQMCMGDASDGYKGIKGVGLDVAVKLLSNCNTVEECCQAICDLYYTKFKNGFTYKSWDGEDVTLTWEEVMFQHSRLAYHERGSKDKLTPLERYRLGKPPIYTGHIR